MVPLHSVHRPCSVCSHLHHGCVTPSPRNGTEQEVFCSSLTSYSRCTVDPLFACASAPLLARSQFRDPIFDLACVLLHVEHVEVLPVWQFPLPKLQSTFIPFAGLSNTRT
uniref:Uncharacterized protein n=1 Tax=Eutreptiella gymnastica TaxID=73025 RepID=A0A7S4CVL7_9EUGL